MTLEARPISALLKDIVCDVQDIVRAEVRLARTEVVDRLGQARSAGVLCGVGAVLSIFSIGFVLLTIVYALKLVMPEWAASLVVAVAIGVAAIVVLQLGIRKFKITAAAPRTAASLKENVKWARQLTK